MSLTSVEGTWGNTGVCGVDTGGSGIASGAGTGAGAVTGGTGTTIGGNIAKVGGVGLFTAGTKVFFGSGFFGTTGTHSSSENFWIYITIVKNWESQC